MSIRIFVAAAVAALSIAGVGSAQAAEPSLVDIIGPGFVLTPRASFSLADFGPSALLKAEYTDGAAIQTFGFYSGSDANSVQAFSGPDTAGAVFALNASTLGTVNPGAFGLYFTSGDRYDLGSSRIQTYYNAGTHVWAFGFEDGGDNDYQDMVITMAPIPEPGTWALMAAGLLAMGALVRRRTVRD